MTNESRPKAAPETPLAEANENSTPAREASAWLRVAAARITTRPEVRALLARGITVLTPIGVGGDRTCDRCRAHTPAGEMFHVFVYQPVRGLYLSGGLCVGCERLEAGS